MPARTTPRSARRIDRYTTLCQQLLLLAVVLVVLLPSAGVISMEIGRGPASGDSGASQGVGRSTAVATGGYALAAYTRETMRTSAVPDQVVDPTVEEYALTAPAASGRASEPGAVGRFSADRRGATTVTSAPQRVKGYGTVGVTWQHGVALGERSISFQVRTEKHGTWSPWQALTYHSEHGPDPGSSEALRSRPGTDESLVGHVDRVQVRSTSTHGPLPADMRLAVISPGVATSTKQETPAIDTGRLSSDPAAAPDTMTPALPAKPAETTTEPGRGSDRIALSAASYTPKPKIYSRAQWGADESMRDKSSLHYFEVHAGFVHHTVNANDYTRAEVPALLRSIYAYHVRSRGWSDIGYNYLVDRFGRIWEGRYGGVDRPVVGAHTLGYNDYSFAMSAIGNFDLVQPSKAMIEAYGALFAWKLSLHGVSAGSTRQRVSDTTFQAINGHRDAASTACPGKYLYARIPTIRKLAAAAQRGWAGRGPQSDIASNSFPDLLVRRASDGEGMIIPTGGLIAFSTPGDGVPMPADVSSVVGSPDLTGDRVADLPVTDDAGAVSISPGGRRGFGARTRATTMFEGHDLLTPVGDLDGDGHNDVVARDQATGHLDVYVGGGAGGFNRRSTTGGVWAGYNLLAATGDLTGDGAADLLGRTPAGVMFLHPGTGTGGFRARVQLAGRWGGFDAVTGFGDYTGDRNNDLVVQVHASGKSFVMPGNGDGTFGRMLGPYSRLQGLTGLSGAGQIAGNRAPDLVAMKGGQLVVVRNRGTVDLRPAVDTGVDLSAADKILAAGDWDRDGHGDMITRNHKSGALWLRRGDGTGHFGGGIMIGAGFARVSLLDVVGDVTGDGYPDLMGQPAGGDMDIYPGRGTSPLGPRYAAHSAITADRQVGVGLWDDDGAPDSAFRVGNTLILYPGNGPGGLTGSRGSLGIDVSHYDWLVGVSDIRTRGHSDLLARESRTGNLYLLQGNRGGFRAPQLLGQGMGAYDLVG